ncbi:TonB-dependent receptor [Methylocystis sp. IM3]|uniref:TonB-dependent receptor domain-containing protein n=2 Tax=unclassified Methylocystis TaxID=2625913 RepID=UPI00311953E7
MSKSERNTKLRRRLLLTGALYQLNRSNQPVTVNAFNAVANTRTRGGEVGLVGYVTDEWQASLGYGFQSGRVLNASYFPNPADPWLVYSGKVTPNVPRNTYSFWNKVDISSLFDAGPGVLGLGGGVIYNAKFYPAIDNAVVVPGYARVDAAAYVKLSDRVNAQLNIENLLGARYYAAATNNNNIMPGAPRSAFVTLNAKF